MCYVLCRLVIGFITKADEGVNVPISECDLQLFQHGEQGVTPKDYGFTFEAGKTNSYIYIDLHIDCKYVCTK